jgi:isoleucyl-tRNA synthetase
MSVSLAPLIPYFCEYLYKNISDNECLSVHLTKFKNYHLPILTEEQNKIADDMKNVLDVITLVFRVRSKNNISMKLPLEKLIVKSTSSVIDILNKYNNYILDELNVLNLDLQTFNISDISIDIKSEFKILKEKYSTDFMKVNDIIKNINDEQKILLATDNKINVDNFEIDSSLCRILIEPLNIDKYYSEYAYINNTNYCVYIYSIITDNVKKLAYTKLIASRFQKMRKSAGLHPWELDIKLVYQGIPEYDLNNEISRKIIYDTCNLELFEFDINENYKIRYQSFLYLDDNIENNLKLYIIDL